MSNAERQKRYREKNKALRLLMAVTKKGQDLTGDMESVMEECYDPKRYPERRAWEIAMQRAARARRYALLFPEKIGAEDLKYQTVDWQYENEGLPAVKSKVTFA